MSAGDPHARGAGKTGHKEAKNTAEDVSIFSRQGIPRSHLHTGHPHNPLTAPQDSISGSRQQTRGAPAGPPRVPLAGKPATG
jgi:hypothetical protein